MRIQIEGYREMLGLKVIASDVTLGKVQRGVWRSGFKFPSVHKCTLYHTPSLWLGRDTGPLWKLIVVVLLVNYGRFVSSSVIVLTISEVSRIFTSLINYRAWMTLLLAQHQTHIISFEHLTFCWGHTHTRSQTLSGENKLIHLWRVHACRYRLTARLEHEQRQLRIKQKWQHGA